MEKDNEKLPICVDLDGALTYTDMLLEIYLQLLKEKPWIIFATPFWILKGKAFLKHTVSSNVHFDPSLLPYNQELLTWLKEKKQLGHPLCLATASNVHIAEKIASHLNIFDSIVCSTENVNILSFQKAEALVHKFGEKQFDYVGDSRADLFVWPKARHAILTNASSRTIQKAQKIATVTKIFPTHNKTFHFPTFFQQIRVHQWIKNILVFVAPIAAHTIFVPQILVSSFIAFISFSLAASAIYIGNDLFDLAADRQHATKRYRPVASGTFSLFHALGSFWILLLLSIAIGLLLPPQFLWLLGSYVVLNLVYSFYMKRIPYIDVILLTSLYVLRIIAGSAATHTFVSPWLFYFAAAVFFSLAFVKRSTEIINLKKNGKKKAPGRGYAQHHLKNLIGLGIFSALISIAVFSIYIQSATALSLYPNNMYLWLIIPLLAFWFGRIWALTIQGKVHEDPVLFATHDIPSYLTLGIGIAILLLAVKPL